MHVLAQAAEECAGVDVPDATVRADVAGHEIFAVRADVERVAQIAEGPEVKEALAGRDVPKLGVA